MRYDIFRHTAPAMPNPSKGTEICKILLSQASKDMRDPLVPMLFPALCAQTCARKNQHFRHIWGFQAARMTFQVAKYTIKFHKLY